MPQIQNYLLYKYEEHLIIKNRTDKVLCNIEQKVEMEPYSNEMITLYLCVCSYKRVKVF